MPIFEYVCAECGRSFEALVLITSKVSEINCPECHSQNITKKVSTFASKFSGGSSSTFGNSFSSSSCGTGSV